MRTIAKVLEFIVYWLGYVLFLSIIVFPIITTHEMGHYLAMRFYRIPVAEFTVGLGPTLLSFFYGGTQWSLRLIVLAGGVLPTMEGFTMIQALPALSQIVIWIAGIVVNLLTVVALATFLQWKYRRPSAGGMIKYLTATIAKIPLLFIGIAFMLATSPIALFFPRFRPRIPFGSGMVVLPQEAKGTLWAILLGVTLFAALANLLPLYPLDGGRILDTLISISALEPIRGVAQTVGTIFTLIVVFLAWTGLTRDDFTLVRYESLNKGKKVEFTVLTISQDEEEPRVALLQTGEDTINIALTEVRMDDPPTRGERSASFTGRIVKHGGKFAEQIHGTFFDRGGDEPLRGWFEME